MAKIVKKHPHFYQKKWFLWPVGSIVGLVLLILIAFRVSPWPGALVIRYVFDKDDVKVAAALEKHTPAVPITVVTNQNYRASDPDALIDAYFPESIKSRQMRLPVVLWTHGGAWVSGDKDDDAGYYKLLAAAGFTVISADYSLAPEKTYPTAVHQMNDLYAYMQTNADSLHADTNNIVLAGDSAGAQLTSQMAAIITNPAYAKAMSVTPSLRPAQLKGVVLNCGIYKMDGLVQPNPALPKIVGWGNDASVWAYLGTRDFSDPAIKQMSAYYHSTAAFPATYIAGGNGDPLTDAQSKPFADKLESLGVKVTRLFYDSSHQPLLPHEYQFNLDNADGQAALRATVTFLKERTR